MTTSDSRLNRKTLLLSALMLTGMATGWTSRSGDVSVVFAGTKAPETKAEAKPATSTGKVDDGKSDPDKPPLGEVTILVTDKEFRPEGRTKALRVGFEDVDVEKVMNTKTVTEDLPQQFPEWLRELDGKRIRMMGFMHPASSFQETGIKRFVLCRDTSVCCFGPNPTVYYLVEVSMKSGTSTSYVENKRIDVEGVFRIKPFKTPKTDKVERLYQLEDAQLVKS